MSIKFSSLRAYRLTLNTLAMTVESKQDIMLIQNYVRKLQEIKSFLQRTNEKEEGLEAKKPLRVNAYWESNKNYSFN